VWGMVDVWPLLVEEDVDILCRQRGAHDGWERMVDDHTARLQVYMKASSESPIKAVMAMCELPTHTAQDAFDAITRLEKYRRWDRTWHLVQPIGDPLDAFNAAYYFIADSPPPPYSYLIVARDFVMLRFTYRDPYAGINVDVLRNACHRAKPADPVYIRGETLSCVGFMVTPVEPPAVLSAEAAAHALHAGGAQVTLMTAADPKGSIPSYLINFVAKRTPRMWADRLAAACTLFEKEAREAAVAPALGEGSKPAATAVAAASGKSSFWRRFV
ncbi:hypothetical protein EON62_02325, partial [archaeon]